MGVNQIINFLGSYELGATGLSGKVEKTLSPSSQSRTPGLAGPGAPGGTEGSTLWVKPNFEPESNTPGTGSSVRSITVSEHEEKKR